MNDITLKSLKILKYILFLLLAIIIIFFFVFKSSKLNDLSETNDVIEVSPISGKAIMTISSGDIIYNLKYDSTNIFDLYKIDEHEIVYQIYNETQDSLNYMASSINDIGSHPGVEYLDSNLSDDFPTLEFINYSNVDNYQIDNKNADIFIEYSENIATSFIYNNGQYKYVNPLTQQSKHNTSNHALTFNNVLIQFIDEDNQNSGEGILFTAGNPYDIIWKNQIFLFKETNDTIKLNTGNTIWIFIKVQNKDSVIYNKK